MYTIAFILVIVNIYTTGILFITAVIQHVHEHELQYILYMALPLATIPLANPRFYLLGTLQM